MFLHQRPTLVLGYLQVFIRTRMHLCTWLFTRLSSSFPTTPCHLLGKEIFYHSTISTNFAITFIVHSIAGILYSNLYKSFALWFQEHANALRHLHKTHFWCKNKLTSLWISSLLFKQHVFLWRFLLVMLPTSSNLQKWSIVPLIVHDVVDDRKQSDTYYGLAQSL